MAYEGIRFSFAEMHREIENLKTVAEPFLDPLSRYSVIPDWQRDLKLFQHEAHPTGASRKWTIAQDNPIKTNLSEGEYEANGRRGLYNIYGSISGVWEISKPPYKGKQKKTFRSDYFILSGMACTKIALWSSSEGRDDVELARWTLEVGDALSPGCHFHTQIKLDDVDNKFPQNLSIPRLPAMLITPMDALDFLLAELFYVRWYEHISRENGATKSWAACQAERLNKIFDWHRQKIRESTGSPWTSLKRQKPPTDIFYAV